MFRFFFIWMEYYHHGNPLILGTWLENVGPWLMLWNLFTSEFYYTEKPLNI